MLDIDDDNIWRVDLYEVLGVSHDISEDELKKVYKQLAKQYHPDRFPAGSNEQEEAKKKEPPREDYKLKEAEDAFKEGTALLAKNKLDEAISAFQQAISILPETAKYHSSLGKAYTLKGWKGMAQSALKQALVLNPNDPTAKKLYEPEKPKKKGMLDGLFGKFKK